MLGGLFALMAAATFALNNASLRRGVLTGTVAQAMSITVPLGLPLFLIAALVTESLATVTRFSRIELGSLALAGIVHFIFGRYCNYRATVAVGANLVAPVQQFSLVWTLLLPIVALGEVLTPLRVLGIALILIGPAFTFRKAKENKVKVPPTLAPAESAAAAGASSKIAPFKPRYAEGYLFAFLSALGYGSSPILVRFAVEDKGIGSSLAAGVVSYAAAAIIVVLALFVVPGRLKHVREITAESAKWFTLSGVMVGVSQMFTYMAMSLAPVSVVVPIQRLSILLRIHFARMLTPEHEVFSAGIILGTCVSLAGAVILSLSADVVLAMLPLPESVANVLRWHWP